jgi:AcrR family transcriptional regulator
MTAAGTGAPPDELEARPSGRPRSAEADEAILRAALELCAEQGFESATVEAVAARAGVGKATVYRRYPNRVGLAVAAATEVCTCFEADADTGSVEEDLRLIARSMVDTINVATTRRMLAEIMAAAARNPELQAAYSQFVSARRAVAIRAIERGVARGELRPDTDAELLADLVGSPLFHRGVGRGEHLEPAYADRVVRAAVRAFRSD